MTDSDLNSAYALDGPESCRRLYAAWAESYDTDFAQGMDYLLPAQVASAFLAAGGSAPVLDVGTGTGLLGAALRGAGLAGVIDGVDLSAPMLARAARLDLYRRLTEADITQPLDLPGGYAGVVSSGTFTHGHVGPRALPHLLALAAPDALFALSVNAGVWDAQGFAPAIAALPIRDLMTAEAPIYGPRAAARDPAHAADRALIVTFRKV
jgi:predicted TPR repeat methyltransferase